MGCIDYFSFQVGMATTGVIAAIAIGILAKFFTLVERKKK
jgi:hypothetical protein